MKEYDLSFYEKKIVKSVKDLKPKGYEKQTEYDIKFLKKFADKNKILLDLGSGTGATINNLVNDFKKIYAEEKFDIVTAFGVFNHLDDEDTLLMYKKVYKSLKKDGIFIVKHGMGIKEDVILKTNNYWAIYRNKTKEKEFLKDAGFKILEIKEMYDDIYKKEKTNYYAIVGVKQ